MLYSARASEVGRIRPHIRDVLSHASCHWREDIVDLHDVAETEGGVGGQIAFEEDADLVLERTVGIESIDDDMTHRHVLMTSAIEERTDADESADSMTILDGCDDFEDVEIHNLQN